MALLATIVGANERSLGAQRNRSTLLDDNGEDVIGDERVCNVSCLESGRHLVRRKRGGVWTGGRHWSRGRGVTRAKEAGGRKVVGSEGCRIDTDMSKAKLPSIVNVVSYSSLSYTRDKSVGQGKAASETCDDIRHSGTGTTRSCSV